MDIVHGFGSALLYHDGKEANGAVTHHCKTIVFFIKLPYEKTRAATKFVFSYSLNITLFRVIDSSFEI